MANTNANGRVVAPAVLQAQLSTDVVGFNLENNQASALGQQYITFQETFLPGEVTTSTHLVAIVGGQKIPVQMDVKTTNADGSVRSALLTFEQPSISANSSLSFMLSTTGTAFATGPLSLAGLNDSNYNLKVTIALQGGSTVVLDAATLLEQALNAGTVSYWQTGPLATQGRIDVPIAGSLHVTLDITRYADGSTSTDVQFNNDYAMQAVGGTAVYNVTIQQNGSTVLQQSNITEYQYQTWHTVVSTTGPSHANVVQDINYLELTGAVPNLDLAAGVDPAALAAERITGNQILGPGSVTKYMPTAGGRSDIGQMPGWNAIWLMTQDEQAAKYALVQADAAGSVPWHYFDPKTGTYLSVTDYPTLWSDPRGTPTLTQQPSSSSGWTPEAAHQPDLSYVAYLLTGDRYYLDQLNAQATFSVFSDWPVYRENGLGLVANGSDEVRAQAWSLRVIDEAAWANPTGSVEQQAFAQLADNNWSWLVSQIPAWTQRQGEAYGYVPGTYGDGSGSTMAPWQQDYFASTAIQAAQMGNADALTFLNWQANFLVGRFLNGANGFNPHDGANYNLIVGNGSGTTYKTWAQIGQATVAAGISWGNGWGDGDYAELAAQTLAGIITLTGSAAATQAYNWLMSSGAPQIKPYFVDPQFDVVPRQTVNTGSATLSIVAVNATQSEGATGTTPFTFTVTRGGNTSIATSASWAAAGSGANPAAGSDFVGGVIPSGTVSFAAGETSKTITVNVAGDTVVEPNEGFTVTLSNPATSTTIGTATANGTIRNDDTSPASLSIAALSADKVEGPSGSTAFTFTVTRGGNTSIATSASWAAAGSGANPAAGSDFVGGVMPSGTVSFAAGETSKTITVNVAGDTVGEPDEGFTVTLSNPATSTTIGTATASGTIRNDDTSQASLSIAALSADKVEGQSESTAFTFTVTRGGNTSIATSASWAAVGSGVNPAAGSDFVDGVLPSGTVSFAAGETSKTITVNVAGDTVGEPDEGFTVTLSNPATNTTIGTATASGMIRDDDVASLSIAALSADKVEGQSGSTAFTFTVTRGGNTSIATSASWAAAGSGANPAAGSDFVDGVLPSGTVSFAAGETSKTITVNVAGDTVGEPDEGFTVTLSNPATSTTIGTATASGTIRDDDAVSLSIAALSADKVEGPSGSTAFTFTVTRGGNASIETSTSWAVAGSGANPAAGADFVGGVLPSGTVSFAAGETSKTITVNVAGDTVGEPNEGFTVTLSNPATSTTIGTASAGGTIRDDDAASLSIAALSANKVEGQSGSTAFTFTVTRGGNASIATSAGWAVAGSGANPAAGSDFVGGVLPSGTVNFAVGETSKTIAVNVAGNTVGEPNEGFTVTLSNPATNTTIGTATANGTIRNDDTSVMAPPQADLEVSSLGLGAASVAQGQNLGFVYTIVNNGPGQSNVGYGGFYIDGTDAAHFGGNNLTDPLGWGASRTLFNGFNTSNLSVGQHTLWVGADNFGQTTESNETNNWRSITFEVTAAPQADLVVSNLGLGAASVAQGQNLGFVYTVVNDGAALSNVGYASFYIDGWDEAHFGGYNLTDPLTTGATRTLFNGFNTSDLSVGQHTLWVGADNYGQTAESNETNNWRSITFTVTAPPQADLEVSSLGLGAASMAQGQNLGFVYTVVNNGPGQSNVGYGGFYIDTLDAAHFQGFNLTDPLGWGASRTLFNGFNTSNLSVGQHTLWVGADNYGQTAESNETNNWRSITFTVTAPPQADLEVSSLGLGAASMAQGQNLGFVYTVVNNGPGQSNVGYGGFYIDTLDAAHFQGFNLTDPLGWGASRTLFNGFNTSNLSVGQHTLWVGADNFGQTSESNETNNYRSITFTVTAPQANGSSLISSDASMSTASVQNMSMVEVHGAGTPPPVDTSAAANNHATVADGMADVALSPLHEWMTIL